MTTSTDRPSRRVALVAALAAAQLFTGGCSVFSNDGSDELDGPPLSDEQARAQVVEPAKRTVEATGLQRFTAAFSFGSCTDQGVPPFRGIAEVAFAFPPGADEQGYVEKIAAAMLADGWSDGPPPGKKPYGRVVHRGDMMAILGPSPDHPGEGDIKIYGECRNATDHRKDPGSGIEDITADLGGWAYR